MKITKKQLKIIIREVHAEEAQADLKGYSPLAIELARKAVSIVGYPQGGLIENEIHSQIDELAMKRNLPNVDDYRWELADEALSVAGIMLGVGPDVL